MVNLDIELGYYRLASWNAVLVVGSILHLNVILLQTALPSHWMGRQLEECLEASSCIWGE